MNLGIIKYIILMPNVRAQPFQRIIYYTAAVTCRTVYVTLKQVSKNRDTR